MPVTTSSIVLLKVSTVSPMGICNRGKSSQMNCTVRSGPKKRMTLQTKETATAAIEMYELSALAGRVNSTITTADTSGANRTIQGSMARSSVLQLVDFADLQRLARAVERDDDGEADGDLGRGDSDNEEDENLAVV